MTKKLEAKTRALQALVLEFAQDENIARARLRDIDKSFGIDSFASMQVLM